MNYTYSDQVQCLKNPSCNTKQIAILANCCETTAQKIKNQIIESHIKPTGLLLTGRSRIPTKLVVQKLKIDIDFIFKMADREKTASSG